MSSLENAVVYSHLMRFNRELPSGHLNMAAENCKFLVNLPILNSDFPYRLPEGNWTSWDLILVGGVT